MVRYFLGPVIALTVMGSFWGLSAALVMFREQGILRRFHVTPVIAERHAGLQHCCQFCAHLTHGSHRIPFRPHHLSCGAFRQSLLDIPADRPRAQCRLPPWASLSPASPTPCRKRRSSISLSGFPDFSFRRDRTACQSSRSREARSACFFPPLISSLACKSAIYWAARSLESWMYCSRSARSPSGPSSPSFCLLNFSAGSPSPRFPRRAKLLVAATAIPFLLLGIWENKTNRTMAQAQAMFESLSAPAKSAPPADSQK